MTTLYSCKSEINRDGRTDWRITKFIDGEVESSYLTDAEACECPAGHRTTCRHRQMLPQFRAHGIVNTHWFMDWDNGGTIVDFSGVPKRHYDAITNSPPEGEAPLAEEPTLPIELPQASPAQWRRI